MNVQTQLGMRIRYLRRERKMSIEDLALASNVNRNYISDLERGMRNPSLDLLNRIVEGLHITLEELFKGIKQF